MEEGGEADGGQRFLILQLSPWAAKFKRVEDISAEIRRLLRNPRLQVHYPVREYGIDKHDCGYGEYVFLEYMPDIDYSALEGECEDYFRALVRNGKNPVIVPVEEVIRVQAAVVSYRPVEEGDTVHILDGAFKGHLGRVTSVGEEIAVVDVGTETGEITTSLAFAHFRRVLVDRIEKTRRPRRRRKWDYR
jgi:transcription antitermination factor NusG